MIECLSPDTKHFFLDAGHLMALFVFSHYKRPEASIVLSDEPWIFAPKWVLGPDLHEGVHLPSVKIAGT